MKKLIGIIVAICIAGAVLFYLKYTFILAVGFSFSS